MLTEYSTLQLHTSSNIYRFYTPTAVHLLLLLCERNVGQCIHMYVMPAVQAATRKLMGTWQ